MYRKFLSLAAMVFAVASVGLTFSVAHAQNDAVGAFDSNGTCQVQVQDPTTGECGIPIIVTASKIQIVDNKGPMKATCQGRINLPDAGINMKKTSVCSAATCTGGSCGDDTCFVRGTSIEQWQATVKPSGQFHLTCKGS
jgi:hypothetical protein